MSKQVTHLDRAFKVGKEPRRVTVLGSTGSIGVNTLDLVARSPASFEVEALTAFRNVDRLVEQALKLRPKLAVVGDPAAYQALNGALSGSGIETAAGPEALIEAAQRPADWVMAAIVGIAGLAPTLAAIRRGAFVALANKETLVSAGQFMMTEIARHGATLLPVDSEHSAIFQVIDFKELDAVDRIILTTSGGPFWRLDRAAMTSVTPAQAVAHPVWPMGPKISVDSATMMNKGLEIIEANQLFHLSNEQIEILVHPEAVVHSLVAYRDGSVLAQLGTPDMRTPIAYALAWPRRMRTPVRRLDLAQVAQLNFEAPDEERFPALRLARHALMDGGSARTVLNGANEIAVHAFLEGRIRFLSIMEVVEETLDSLPTRELSSLDDVAIMDGEARKVANRLIKQSG